MQLSSTSRSFRGKAVADDRANPTVAQINIGPFTIFGGNVEHPLAQKLTKDFGSGIVAYSERDWRNLIENVHGERLEVRKRTAFSATNLDLEHSRHLSTSVPKGFEIKRMDEETVCQIEKEAKDLHLRWIHSCP